MCDSLKHVQPWIFRLFNRHFSFLCSCIGRGGGGGRGAFGGRGGGGGGGRGAGGE